MSVFDKTQLNADELGQLEKLVDMYGLHAVLFSLGCVCREKAEHLRVNWQDRQTGHAWDKAADKLERLGTMAEPLY